MDRHKKTKTSKCTPYTDHETKYNKPRHIYTKILYIYTHTSAILIDHWNVKGKTKVSAILIDLNLGPPI